MRSRCVRTRRTTLCLLVCAALAACSGRAQAPLADVHAASGTVERQPRLDAAWGTARVGDGLSLGSALRTGGESSAVLTLRGGGRMQVSAKTTVRFSGKPGRRLRLDVDTGAIELESAGDALEIDTSFGLAVLEPGGSARLVGPGDEGDGARLQILVGELVLERDGKRVTLAAGDEIGIELGEAELVPIRRKEPDPPPPTLPDAGPAVVATSLSVEVAGKGAQMQTPAGWQPIPEGASTIAPGTHVRVAAGTTLAVIRGDERAVVIGSAEVIAGGADGVLIEGMRGEVTVTAQDRDVRIAVPGGVIIARGGGNGSAAGIDVDAKGKQTRVTAQKGTVEVLTGSENDTLHAGESVAVQGSGKVVDLDRAPLRADFSVTAGESAVVHDAKPPAAVRIQFGALCAGEAVVEVPRGKRPTLRSVGTGGANLLLEPGKHRYRVRCLTAGEPDAEVRAEGAITLLKDSGKVTLPRHPPANVVDADGRPYLVVYQNLLPDLTFRWPRAPAAASYTLHVDPRRGEKITMEMSKPDHSCLSGELGEGDYEYWFEAAGGARSPVTRLTIEFDNAAATAYIRRVAPGEGGALHVEGAALPGWAVTAAGVGLATDGAGRFAVDLSPATGEDAVTIRLEHPDHGVHYYVVRSPSP